MSAAAVLAQAERAGVRLRLVQGRVRMEAAAAPAPSLVAALREARDEVVVLLAARLGVTQRDAMTRMTLMTSGPDSQTALRVCAPVSSLLQPSPVAWPAEVDFCLTRDAARLSGLISSGTFWRWCPNGGIDVEKPDGMMWLISPSLAGRLRNAGLLHPEVADTDIHTALDRRGVAEGIGVIGVIDTSQPSEQDA